MINKDDELTSCFELFSEQDLLGMNSVDEGMKRGVTRGHGKLQGKCECEA